MKAKSKVDLRVTATCLHYQPPQEITFYGGLQEAEAHGIAQGQMRLSVWIGDITPAVDLTSEPTVCPVCDGTELIEEIRIKWADMTVHGLKCLACGKEVLWVEIEE